MNKHYGQIVEYIVRRKGISITDLATELNVNRRTLYNCFGNKYLKAQIIHKIGFIIKHDFSKEFAELFTAEDFALIYAPKIASPSAPIREHWKNKYLELLEKYTNVLTANNSPS
jgi:AcrR family transcriptional regulator